MTNSLPRESTPSVPSSARPVLIGIAGGIGSGKSYATSTFASLGAAVFDADAVARKISQEDSVLAIMRERWPDAFPDGRLDRARLAALVFDDSPAGRRELDFLNSVLHPRILDQLRLLVEELRDLPEDVRPEFLIVDAPLLFEIGWDVFVNCVVFVDAPLELRRERVRNRGWSDDELRKREERQLPLEEKRVRSRFVLKSGEKTREQAEAILTTLRDDLTAAERDAG